MWALKNRTAYAAERNWTRDKGGVHWWLVAVKATFDITPGGRLVLADEQPPPVLMPEYFGEPGLSSLRFDSDLLAAKPSTDVLIVSHAHAPQGKPAPTVPVALRIGPFQKILLVHGDRTYSRGLTGVATTRPQLFTRRPIRYEFAFGGCDLSDPDPKRHCIDERNPIGRGFAEQGARPGRIGSHCPPPTQREAVPPPRSSCSSWRTRAAPLASPSSGFIRRRVRQPEKSDTTTTARDAWNSSENRLTMAPLSHRATPATSLSP
jgi:hypothetical protein